MRACVRVGGGGGRGQDVITIRTSANAKVSRMSTARDVGGGGGGGGGSGYKCILLIQRVLVYACAI